MSTYADASLIYYHSGYKAGTAYSLKPTDGRGDLTFTRASTATRRNQVGIWVSEANNVPLLNYPVGSGCGSLLLQSQYTNLNIRSQEINLWQDLGGTSVTTNVDSSIISGQESSRLTFDGAGFRIRRTFPFNISSNNLYMGVLLFVKNENFTSVEVFNITLTNSTASPNDFALQCALNVVAKTGTFSLSGGAGTGRVGSPISASVTE